MLSGTEADIINSVARLKEATKNQIRRRVGFSLDYVGFLCEYLVRKGYLNFSDGYYSLTKMGGEALLTGERSKVNPYTKDFGIGVGRKLIKEISPGITDEMSKVQQIPEEKIKIKTDFELLVEDESLFLKSNINKIGPDIKKEKSDIDRPVKLFKEIQRRGRRDG